MNIDQDDKLIRDLFEAVETPQYDVTKDVLAKISKTPTKKIALKQVIVVATIVCVCAVLLGAVKLVSWQRFNIFGEVVPENNDVLETPMPQAVPFTVADMSFEENTELGEVRLMLADDNRAASWQIGSVRTDDFDVICDYLDTYDSFVKMPSYIPEGYSFKEGSIQLYLDKNSLKSELVSSETKDGILYEIYKLPNGFEKNISYLSLDYVDENGNYLNYDVMLEHKLDENTFFAHGAIDSAVVKKIDVSGFNEGIIIHDKKKTNVDLNIAVLYYEFPEIDVVHSFCSAVHPPDIPGWDERAYMHTLCAAITRVKVDSLLEEEVIKIVQSIK
jgi:hypothetical protein